MATPVKGSEIVEQDWQKDSVAGAKELKLALEADTKAAKELGAAMDQIGKAEAGDSAASINKLNKALVQSTNARESIIKTQKEQKKLQTEEEKLTARLTKAKSEEGKAIAKLRTEINQVNRANRDQAKAVLEADNAYKVLVKDTTRAQNEFKRLAAQFGVNSVEARKARIEFDRLDKELREVNTAAKDGRSNVGNYGTAFKGAAASIGKFAGALGIVGGIQLLTKGLRDAFNVVRNFDQAQANLASVLGTTTDGMAKLTDQAKELGATTKFTASQVSELQLEFAKLGFTQDEINNVTEATLQLAAAAGTELANAATIVGSTLRGFGLEATETQRLVDVMAKSFSSSSLDIDKFSTAMAAVAPAANAVGLSIEETTSLIAILTNAGIDASTAGTGLRNMFLALKDSGLSMDEALAQINNSSDKLQTSFELFGKRGATLGVVLSENQESAKALTEELENSAGAAEEMADKQLNTLNGALDLLRSAWEGYILGVDGASGVSENLKNIVRFLADNLNTILDTLVLVAKTFVTYKVATIAATTAVKAYNIAQSISTKGLKAFNTAAKLNPFGFIASGLILITSLFWDNTEATEINTDAVDENAEANRSLNEELRKQEAILRELNAQLNEGSTTLEKLSTENLKSLRDQYKENIDATESLTKAYSIQDDQLKLGQKPFEDYLLSLLRSTDITNEGITALHNRRDALLRLEEVEEQLAKRGEKADLKTEKRTSRLNRNIEKTEDDLRKEKFEKLKKDNENFLKRIETDLLIEKELRSNINKTISQERLVNLQLEQAAALKLFGEFSDEFIAADLALQKELEKQRKESLENQIALEESLEEARLNRRKQRFEDLQNQNKENETIITTNLIAEGKTREQIEEELSKIRLENLKAELEQATDLWGAQSEEAIKAQERLNNEVLSQSKNTTEKIESSYKELANTIADSFAEIAQVQIEALDTQIERKENEVGKRESEISRLQELGTANAAEAIKAEEQQIAQREIEIEALERKKRNLLAATVLLERTSQLINQGSQDPFNQAGQELSGGLESIPSFFEGTDQTLGHALGNTHTKDGHFIRAHDNEHIISSNDSDKLHKAGFTHTKDIVSAAMRDQQKSLNSKVIRSRPEQLFTDENIIRELKQTKEAIKSIQPVIHSFDFKSFVETVKSGSHVKNIDHGNDPYKV